MATTFAKTAKFYDKIYSRKDYTGECDKLLQIIREKLPAGRHSLLDVACGTGRHIEHLKTVFDIQGVDISEELLEIARERNPDVDFHCEDMMDFDLDQEFDIVTCLASSIGTAQDLKELGTAINCMAQHLKTNGLLIVEPWITPEDWKDNSVHGHLVEVDDTKIAQMSTSFSKGRCSYFDMHYLVGTPKGTAHIVEHHSLGLFSTQELTAIIEEAGFGVEHDPVGLMGRGLFVGQKTEAL